MAAAPFSLANWSAARRGAAPNPVSNRIRQPQVIERTNTIWKFTTDPLPWCGRFGWPLIVAVLGALACLLYGLQRLHIRNVRHVLTQHGIQGPGSALAPRELPNNSAIQGPGAAGYGRAILLAALRAEGVHVVLSRRELEEMLAPDIHSDLLADALGPRFHLADSLEGATETAEALTSEATPVCWFVAPGEHDDLVLPLVGQAPVRTVILDTWPHGSTYRADADGTITHVDGLTASPGRAVPVSSLDELLGVVDSLSRQHRAQRNVG